VLMLTTTLTSVVALASTPPLPVGPLAPNQPCDPPTPHFSWDFIPTSYHGARKDDVFNRAEVERLAKYQVMAVEKWYTKCGSKGPKMSGPDCDVEGKIEHLFERTRAIAPNQTTVSATRPRLPLKATYLAVLFARPGGWNSLLHTTSSAHGGVWGSFIVCNANITCSDSVLEHDARFFLLQGPRCHGDSRGQYRIEHRTHATLLHV
jgi:hypothetical protein